MAIKTSVVTVDQGTRGNRAVGPMHALPGLRNVVSSRSCRSVAPEERNVASSHMSLTSRAAELAMEAAALKAGLRHIDINYNIEAKVKANLEKNTTKLLIAHSMSTAQ